MKLNNRGERWRLAERDRRSLFAQALIQGPSRLRLPFTNLCLSYSHPHLRPSSLSLADHSQGTNNVAREHRTLGCQATTHWLDGVEATSEASVRTVSRLLLDLSPDNPIHTDTCKMHQKCVDLLETHNRIKRYITSATIKRLLTDSWLPLQFACQTSPLPPSLVLWYIKEARTLSSLLKMSVVFYNNRHSY